MNNEAKRKILIERSYIDDEKERAYVHILLGRRKPKTKWEKELKKEIDEMEARDIMPEIPSNL